MVTGTFTIFVPALPSVTDAAPGTSTGDLAASDQTDAEIEITVIRMSPPPLGAGSRPLMQAVRPTGTVVAPMQSVRSTPSFESWTFVWSIPGGKADPSPKNVSTSGSSAVAAG